MQTENRAQISASMPFSATKLRYSRSDAAHLLSISIRRLDYHIANGRLKVRRDGVRVMIEAHELRRFAGRDHVSLPAPIM